MKRSRFFLTAVSYAGLSALLATSAAAQLTVPTEGWGGETKALLRVNQYGQGSALEGFNMHSDAPCPTPPCGGSWWEGPFTKSVGVRGYSLSGYGGWFDSGKDHLDLVVGGAAGRINSDPEDPDSTLILSSNRDVDVRLDNDGGEAGLFNIRNSGGAAVLTVNEQGRVTTAVLEISGGSDLSERFEIRSGATEPSPGLVVSIDPENPGALVVSHEAHDRKVAGVISGAGHLAPGVLLGRVESKKNPGLPVALTGRVYCWAETSNGPIGPGDLLTTSRLPGHAMKVTDHRKAWGAILGKAMTELSQARGLVLVLLSLQ
ncbi:MAG TPA: hypothetical protein VJP78_01960 [Thermoleophilia bacterium]|nr:hypothetical protein [Thermoleophilia bacterium]